MVATMLSDHARDRAPLSPSAFLERPATAVLLNANARQVNDRVRQAIASLVPAHDLFLSRGPDEAARIAETVVGRRYGTVFTGGGDGTFVGWVNRILDRTEERRVPAPRFGVMALGTGNAVAEVVGARKDGHVQQLREFLAGGVHRTRRLDLIACEGKRTPFAGLGIDAAVLNDYNWLKGKLRETAARGLSTGIPGYGLAIALRSAPRQLLERRPSYCEIVNTGRTAWHLDASGRRMGQPVETGELLYAGPAMMAAAATVPFYGFGLRAFPFAASEPGMMQVRVVSRIPVATLLWNLPQVWSGQFAHPGLLDFHAESVEVHWERPVPLQLGGDAEGWREEIAFGMARPVDLVDFHSDLLH
jgi:diacylglycerol kinase family enzyme